LLKLLVLLLLPGALATLAYLALVPFASRVHFPTMSALLRSAAIALVPLEMGHLLLPGKRLNGRWSLAGIVLYQRKWAGWRYFLMALGLFVLSVAGYTLSEPLDHVWKHMAFSCLPGWYVFSDLEQYAQFSRTVLIVTFSARLLLDGFRFPSLKSSIFVGICCLACHASVGLHFSSIALDSPFIISGSPTICPQYSSSFCPWYSQGGIPRMSG
jgi:hypothetical protein